MKKRIRLTEGGLHKIIRKCVNEALCEMENFTYTCDDYRDAGTTANVKYFGEVKQVYNALKRWVQNSSKKRLWDIFHDDEWEGLRNHARSVAETFAFKNKYDSNASDEDIQKIQDFAKNVRNIEYPDMPLASGFADKAENIIKALKQYYHEYNDLIDYFMDKHNDPSMKQKDMKADWDKFDSTLNARKNSQQLNANYSQALRTVSDPFGYSHKRGALDRYDSVIDNDDEYNQMLLNDRYLD